MEIRDNKMSKSKCGKKTALQNARQCVQGKVPKVSSKMIGMSAKQEKLHWADAIAKELIESNPKKNEFTVEAGITPSGVVHIGNFREIITVDLIAKALKNAGKKVRFVYSWDDYDVFRKVPANMPNQEMLAKYLRYPIVEVPDPFGKEKSYARHNEVAVEKHLPIVGIFPEFVSQAERYTKCVYAEEIRTAMRGRAKIKEILDKYRAEEFDGPTWFPARIFCEKCRRDETKITGYDEEYSVSYECVCGFKDTFDIRKKGIIKLSWRIDWPMHWHYENVDFEPSGKDHSSLGGSYTTGEQIIRAIWKKEPPKHIMYEFISIKGQGGKMSSSKGNTIDLEGMLNVYQPEIIRYLFASKLPHKYFEVSFEGMDVIRLYDEFQKLERIYFGREDCLKEDLELNKRFYELSCVSVPKKMPSQVNFKHLVSLLQIFQMDEKKVASQFNGIDKNYLNGMIPRAKFWLGNYAGEQFKFTVQENVRSETVARLSEKQKSMLRELGGKLSNQSEEELVNLFSALMAKHSLQPGEFFQAAYLALINKEAGPKLSGFLLTIDLERAKKLFLQV
ncbi:MAG: lysine--tRNA ligase [Candidatus Diapherotrites archaeon]|nr:lysine--tRNA ligase [Candidatus Diapherotrites archaeon]